MQNSSGFRTFITAEVLAANTRVMLDSNGKVVAADADESKHIGVTTTDAASGDAVTVKLHNAAGTNEVIVAGAVAVGALLYPSASGKVNDVQNTNKLPLYRALQAGGADGDIVEAVTIASIAQP